MPLNPYGGFQPQGPIKKKKPGIAIPQQQPGIAIPQNTPYPTGVGTKNGGQAPAQSVGELAATRDEDPYGLAGVMGGAPPDGGYETRSGGLPGFGVGAFGDGFSGGNGFGMDGFDAMDMATPGMGGGVGMDGIGGVGGVGLEGGMVDPSAGLGGLGGAEYTGFGGGEVGLGGTTEYDPSFGFGGGTTYGGGGVGVSGDDLEWGHASGSDLPLGFEDTITDIGSGLPPGHGSGLENVGDWIDETLGAADRYGGQEDLQNALDDALGGVERDGGDADTGDGGETPPPDDTGDGADAFDEDYWNQYLEDVFGDSGDFGDIEDLMNRQRDDNLRQMAEMYASRGMGGSGALGESATDVYLQSGRDVAIKQAEWKQQQIDNMHDALGLMFQDRWNRLGREQQQLMANLMYELQMKAQLGADYDPDEGLMEAAARLAKEDPEWKSMLEDLGLTSGGKLSGKNFASLFATGGLSGPFGNFW